MRGRRLGVLGVLGLAVASLAVAATAFACARLATLKLDRANGTAGVEVTAIGRNFNSSASASPIALRFNSRSGKVLWEGRPDASGRFKASFVVPRAAPGYYVVMATQQTATGAPAPGTPGRSSLRIRGKSSRAGSGVPAAPIAVAGPTGGGGPSAPVILAMTALLIGLPGGALWLAGRTRRARRVSVLGRAS